MFRSYQFRPELIDTDPGASALCPFAPPPGFLGGGADYTELMRRRFKSDEHRRYFLARIDRYRSGESIEFCGAFAEEAGSIVRAVAVSSKK